MKTQIWLLQRLNCCSQVFIVQHNWFIDVWQCQNMQVLYLEKYTPAQEQQLHISSMVLLLLNWKTSNQFIEQWLVTTMVLLAFKNEHFILYTCMHLENTKKNQLKNLKIIFGPLPKFSQDFQRMYEVCMCVFEPNIWLIK